MTRESNEYIERLRSEEVANEKKNGIWPTEYPKMDGTFHTRTHMAHFYYMFDHMINPDIGSDRHDITSQNQNRTFAT